MLATLVTSPLTGSSPCSSCFPWSSYRSRSLHSRSPRLPIVSPVIYHTPQLSTVFVIPNQLPPSIYLLPLSSSTIHALSPSCPWVLETTGSVVVYLFYAKTPGPRNTEPSPSTTLSSTLPFVRRPPRVGSTTGIAICQWFMLILLYMVHTYYPFLTSQNFLACWITHTHWTIFVVSIWTST